MDITNKKVMILGAWGLVGNAITRKILEEEPSHLILTSLRKEEVEEYKRELLRLHTSLKADQITTWWGNIFVRDSFKDLDRSEILNDPKMRSVMHHDVMEELNEEILQEAALFKLIKQTKPDIIIDCVNTATGIAYQDIYSTYRHVQYEREVNPNAPTLQEELDKIFCTLYIPQLIRHIQILYTAMSRVKTKAYIKIGTSGTGGMGLNIPYTHSEEKPSRMLLSKSAIAGAHTMLLFLMGRTPESAITKEIKPTAAIAWKKIDFGEIKKRNKPVEVLKVKLDDAIELNGKITNYWEPEGTYKTDTLKAVFIDTGENGVFSRGEFEAITAQGQMEFVTPEEIADAAVFELRGGNTGHDIINALDNATLEPSYRAGFLQHSAVNILSDLEKQYGKDSVAFEQVGPPRLSKLLFEAYLIKRVVKDLKSIPKMDPGVLADQMMDVLEADEELRSEIVSIGIPILLKDGKRLLRGKMIKIPNMHDRDEVEIGSGDIDTWSNEGWVDLRSVNIAKWVERIKALIQEAKEHSETDTSSAHVRTMQYWKNFNGMDIGKVVSWIFIREDHGKRMKA